MDMKDFNLDYLDNIVANGKAPVTVESNLPEIPKDEEALLPTLKISPMEEMIIKHAAAGKTIKQISTALGIPQNTIGRLLAKEEVKDFIDSMIQARNRAMIAYLPSLLMEVIEARVDELQKDPEASMAGLSKRDIVDIAKLIGELGKNTTVAEKETSPIMQFYQNLNVVAQDDK